MSFTYHGQTFVQISWYHDRVNEDADEIVRQTLIDELDQQTRKWSDKTVRRGVRRLVAIVRERLATGQIDVESRAQVSAAVLCVGHEPGWLPCDMLTVSRAIMSGSWDEELAQPLCTWCRQKQDVCTTAGWTVGSSMALIR